MTRATCHRQNSSESRPAISRPASSPNNRRHPSLSNREWVELRNVAMSCYVQGKNSLLQFRGRRQAARL